MCATGICLVAPALITGTTGALAETHSDFNKE